MLRSKYLQGFLIPLFLFVAGMVVEYLTSGTGVTLPSWPKNLYLLVGFALYIILIYRFLSQGIKNLLWGIEYAVGVITVYALMVLLMGFIKQDDFVHNELIKRIGFSHLSRSWELLLVSVYLLMILGLTVLKRFKKLNSYRNLAFFLNHFGIWLVIASASVATGDLVRATVALAVNEQSSLAKIDNHTLYHLPFFIKLNKFEIETYTPDVIFYNPHTHEILNNPSEDYSISGGKTYKFDKWKFEIKSFVENAIATNDSSFKKSDSVTNEYAAFVTGHYGAMKKEFWISSGNYKKPAVSFRLAENLAITLTLPQEKKYLSVIDIIDKDNIIRNIKIKVNKPFSYKGFDIYQSGYNLDYGEKISVLEIVKDPWLPIVYIGLVMLVLGSLMLLWTGKIK